MDARGVPGAQAAGRRRSRTLGLEKGSSAQQGAAPFDSPFDELRAHSWQAVRPLGSGQARQPSLKLRLTSQPTFVGRSRLRLAKAEGGRCVATAISQSGAHSIERVQNRNATAQTGPRGKRSRTGHMTIACSSGTISSPCNTWRGDHVQDHALDSR